MSEKPSSLPFKPSAKKPSCKPSAPAPETPPLEPLPATTRVLVVDDHPPLLRGIASLIAEIPGLTLCGTASDSKGVFLALDDDHPPDLILLDLCLQNEDGLELIKQIRSLRPGTRILVISFKDEWIYAERVVRAGASGYIMKLAALDNELIKAVQTVLRGELYLSPRMQILLQQEGIIAEDPFAALKPRATPSLSDREFQTFRLMGAGLSTKEIAKAMHISGKTVETYQAHIKIKMNLPDAEALSRAAKKWVREMDDR